MKKIMVIALLLLVPSIAFAAYSDKDTRTVTLGSSNSLDVATSNQVQLDYAAGTGGATFVLGTFHAKGTRCYMSSSEDASIYYDDGVTTPTAIPAAPSVGTSIGASGSFTNTL